MPNATFLAQFRGELCEEQTQQNQKMKKTQAKKLEPLKGICKTII